MLEGAYLLSHGGAVPGREAIARALLETSRNFWRTQEANGKVKVIGPFFLTPGGGSRDDMAFFTLYQGNLAELSRIIMSEEYERIYALAALVTKNLTGRLFGGGTEEEVRRILSVSAEEWAKQGLVKE